MRIRGFDYYAAKDLEDALFMLQEHGPRAKIVAGGTDLVLALKKKSLAPSCLISLHRVRELDYVDKKDSQVRIGALTTFSTIAANESIREDFPLLSEAAGLIGSWQIRNVATIGGNLCTASPAADSATALLALDAQVVLADASGETSLPLASFFTGPGETVLRHGQLLKEIILNLPAGRSAGHYLKLMRRKGVDLALVGVAFQAMLDESEERLGRVALSRGGVAPTPIRATNGEAALIGLAPAEAVSLLPEVARKAAEMARPISDVRASSAYRRAIVEVYVQRAGQGSLSELSGLEGSGK
jgi:CO/xanthine dehydrogenase FAD-binding subunit